MGVTEKFEDWLSGSVIEVATYECPTCGTRLESAEVECPECEGEATEVRKYVPVHGEFYM